MRTNSEESVQTDLVTPRTKIMCKRMASDTDLWMSVKVTKKLFSRVFKESKLSLKLRNFVAGV